MSAACIPTAIALKEKKTMFGWIFRDLKILKPETVVSFYADVYRYVKTGNGKVLDYSLKNPQDIERIGSYQLPSDDDLANQSINEIICETCFLSDHCNRTYCMRNQEEFQVLREQMSDLLKHT